MFIFKNYTVSLNTNATIVGARTCRRFAAALGFAALAQASMGVATLMLYVPIPLAAAHQAGSVVVWTCALGVVRSLRFLPK